MSYFEDNFERITGTDEDITICTAEDILPPEKEGIVDEEELEDEDDDLELEEEEEGEDSPDEP